jgi:DNA mismatch repair ATPase MutS
VPWSQVAVYFLERHRQKIAIGFPKCIEELSELEVLGSLLIFDKYQTQTYPEFADTTTLQCQQVYHPLLERSRAVANDFSFPVKQTLGLLTGSNMSGKSTFLRTVGVNQVLANMGAPVFAEKFVTVPLKLETCIEVSDSLRDGYSYFYAEVRRLRDILKVAATSEPVLFLIDEIFRGTNNRERQIGSRAVIKTLAQQPTAIGFISTHDLELTNLEQAHPSLINLHFREDINDRGEMVFSYQLRHGPCPTTNALRIMKAEGINVEDI